MTKSIPSLVQESADRSSTGTPPKWSRYIKATVTIATIIGGFASLILPVLLYILSQREFEITLRATSDRSLVSIDRRNVDDVVVTYQGAEVREPWLVSFVVENTGTSPIEASDVRTALSIRYGTSSILRSVVTGVSPRGVVANLTHSGQALTLTFDLLNPGDTISFDALFGDAPGTPQVDFRMRGKHRVVTALNPGQNASSSISWPATGGPYQYVVLSLASLGPLLWLLIAVIPLVTAFDDGPYSRRHEVINSAILRAFISSQGEEAADLVIQADPWLSHEARFFLSLARVSPSARWIEHPEELKVILTSKVPGQTFVEMNTTPEEVAGDVSRLLRRHLLRSLRSTTSDALPEARAAQAIRELSTLDPEADLAEIVESSKKILGPYLAGNQNVEPSGYYLRKNRPLRKVAFASLASFILLSIGVAAASIVARSWLVVLAT